MISGYFDFSTRILNLGNCFSFVLQCTPLQNRWKFWVRVSVPLDPAVSSVHCLCCTSPVMWHSSWVFLVNVIACVKSISSCKWNRNYISLWCRKRDIPKGKRKAVTRMTGNFQLAERSFAFVEVWESHSQVRVPVQFILCVPVQLHLCWSSWS